MSYSVSGSVTALLITALACQPAAKTETAMGTASEAAAPAGLSAADEAAIRAIDGKWATAATAGDANAVAALYTADAIVLPPGQASVQGDAAKEFWNGFFNAMAVQVELNTKEIEGRGDLAYATGTYRMTLTPKKPGAKPLPTEDGKYVEILKKQADGSWKIVHDIWNASGPAPR